MLDALCELLDNCFGLDRGNATVVDITFREDGGRRVLDVLDNGRGMALSDLFVLGRGAGDRGMDIGRYGQGGSNAIIWMADYVEVWSLRGGRVAHTQQPVLEIIEAVEAGVNRWFEIDDDWTPALPINVPTSLYRNSSGVLLRLILRADQSFVDETIKKNLRKRYALALRSGRTITWTGETAESLSPWDPGMPGSELDAELEVRGLKATLHASLVPKLPDHEAGLSINFGMREILRTRDAFGDYAGNKIYGYIDLSEGWRVYLTTTKEGITSDVLYNELIAAAEQELRPLIELAEEEEFERMESSIRLQATITLSPFLRKIAKKRPGPHKVKAKPKGRCAPELDGDEEPEKEAPEGLPIEIRRVKKEESPGMQGQYMTANLGKDKLVITWDPYNAVVAEAARRNFNGPFFQALLVDAFYTELRRKGEALLVEAGLVSADEWTDWHDALRNDYGEALELKLAAYVKPRLFNTIRVPEKRPRRRS